MVKNKDSEVKLKNIVKETYGKIAAVNKKRDNSCYSSGCGCGGIDNFMLESYNGLSGYNS